MLDSIFTKIKEEVAIRGYQGICIEEVWSIVENETIRKIKERGATEDPTPTIDMAYKNYVWKFMRIIKEINYYEKIGEEIAPTNNIAGTFDGLKKEDISILNRKPETRDGEKRLKAARAKVARIARERRLKKEKEKKKQKDSDMDDDEGDVDDVKIVRNANQMQLRTEKPDNYKLIPNIKTIEYSEIIERYGGTLYVVATEKLQKEQLFLAIPAGRTLSPNTTYVLFTILQAKNVGIPQRDLTKVLNLDSRSTGHYVKVLEKRGAIVRKCYSYQGITTRLCIHVRFNRPDLRIQFQEENNEADMADISDKLMPYNVNTLGVPYSPKMLDNSITDVLLDAKDNVMFSHDIMKALGFNSKRFRVRKWFNRAIDIFCLRGHIQKFVATDRLKGKVLRCLKLTDPIKAIAIREGARTTVHVREKDDKRFEVPIIKKRDPLLPISGILKDSTLDSQILAHLIEAGTKGYTQKEIAKLTSCGDNRMLYKLMDKLAKLTGPASDSYVCRRELEFGGRNRRYRYFYKKSDDKENDITSFIKLEHPPTNIPEGSISEINHFNHAPTQIRIPTHRRGRPPKSETQKAKEKVSAINIYPKRPVLTGEREYASVFSSPSSMEIEPSKRNETKKKETKRKEAKGKEPKENNPEEKEVEKEVEKICGRKRSLRATITSSNTSVKRPSVRKRAKSKIENQKPLVFTTMEEPVPTSSTSVDDNVMEITSTEKKDDQQENESPSTALTVGEDGSFTVCLTRQVLGPTISVPAPTKGKRGRKPALSNSKYSSSIAKVEKAPLKRSSRKQKIAESLPKPLEDVSDIDPNTTELPPTRNELSHKVEFNMTQSISACTSVIDPVDVSRENTLNKATLTVSEDTTVDTPSASKRKFQSINSSEDDTTAIDEHVEEISTSVKKKEPVKRTKISDFFKVSTPKKSVTRSSTHQATPTNEQKDEPIMIEQESAKSNLSVEPENNINVLAKPTFENMPIALASREITEEKMDIDEIHQQENDSSTEIVKAETNSPSDATATADTSLEIDLITADPPCPSVSELNSNVAEALAKKISQNPLNAYLEQRKVVLLACLDETPFIERGVAIRRLYKQKYEQLFGQPKIKSSICLKTIWRSAVSLEKEGKVKLYNESYTHLNGSTVIKRYIIRRDIDINGPDMKRYITHLSMDRALQPSVYATSKFEKLNTHVEGIDERLLRMEKSLEVAIAEEKHNEFKKLENQIRSLKNNLKVSIAAENLTNPSDKKNFGNWMMIASQYGYINSRMIRAKELHQFMDTLLYKNVPEIDANERIIPVVSMIKYMPLRLYLQIIGMFNPSKDFQEYIKIPGNSEMLITDLPQHLRLLMLHKKGRLRQHIRVALDILESLNIIKRRGYKVPDMLVSSGSGEYTDSNQYTLALEVPIMNLKNKEQNIIRTYKLQTNSDIHIYWSDLQYLCTHEEVKGPEIELITDSLPLRSFLSTIFSHRNWSVSYQFSHYQRAALNSHVDKIEGLTPMRNIKLCKDLAEKLGISLTTIRGYYRKVEDAFIRKREENSVKKIERSLRPTRRSRKSSLASKEGRNITLKTLHAFKRRKHWTIAQRLVSKQEDLYKMNPSLRPTDTDKKEPYLDNYEDAPYLSEHLIEMGLVPDNFRRSKWSEREEEILIYSYVIIKERSSHSRFVWSAMRNVIPDRRPSTSRYRIAKLKKNQQSVERLAYLSHIWRIFYNEGCKNGDIVDNNIYDMVDFDLLGQLEYFFKRLMDTPMNDIKIDYDLPLVVNKTDHIIRNISKQIRPLRYPEDEYHQMISLVQKHHIFCSQTAALRLCKKECNDVNFVEASNEQDAVLRRIAYLKSFFKMVFMTPEENYDSYYSYAVIHQYPPSQVQKATKDMHLRGLLIRRKAGGYRHLPGINISVSEKFIRVLSGTLPFNFFLQAQQFLKHIQKARKVEFMPVLVSSGMMGVLLDMFSCGKIHLSMKNYEKEIKRLVKPHSKCRLINSSLSEFDINIEYINTMEEDMNCNSLVERELIPLTSESFQGSCYAFLARNPELTDIVRAIISALEEHESDGLTMFDIMCHENINTRFSDIDISHAVDILSKSTPPLVARVGFESYRIVRTCNLENWMVLPSKVFVPTPHSEENIERIKKISSTRKTIVPLRIWNDVNGLRTESVWKGCLQIVIEIVMNRPGIIEADIHRSLKHTMTRTEVEDILTSLVELKALRRYRMHCKNPKVSLFEKTNSFVTSKPGEINSTVRTCYWVLSGYYSIVH